MRLLMACFIAMMSGWPVCESTTPTSSSYPDPPEFKQKGSVIGTVTKVNNTTLVELIDSALVCCLASDRSCAYSDSTDEGDYLINNIPVGYRWVRVVHKDFKADSAYIFVTMNRTHRVDFELHLK